MRAQSRILKLVLIIAFPCMFLSACRTVPKYYFVPTKNKSLLEKKESVVTHHFVPIEYEDQLSIALKAAAYRQDLVDNMRIPTIQARFYVRNKSPHLVRLQPRKTYVKDDEGRRLPLTDSWINKVKSRELVVGRGEKAVIDLFFEAPGGYRLRRLGSFRLFWVFSLGEKTYYNETKLLRAESTYHYPPYHPYYGSRFYWHWGFPYYWDPWPFWPWPYWRWGASIHFGYRYPRYRHRRHRHRR
jgi:hypothetical protein